MDKPNERPRYYRRYFDPRISAQTGLGSRHQTSGAATLHRPAPWHRRGKPSAQIAGYPPAALVGQLSFGAETEGDGDG